MRTLFIFTIIYGCFHLVSADISASTIDLDMSEIDELGANFLVYTPDVARQYSKTICEMISECCPQFKSTFISMVISKRAEDITKECFGKDSKFFRNLISCPLLGKATTLGFKSDVTKYESIYSMNVIEDIEDVNMKLRICSEEELYSIVCDWSGSDLQRRCDRRIFENFAEQGDEIYEDKVRKIKQAYVKLADELKKQFYD